MKRLLKKQKGITLIALVVTIVVLLILAGVSISMLTGENGVITQAQKSKEETIVAKEKETITLAVNAIKSGLKNVDETNMQEEIDKIEGEGKVEVTTKGSILEIKFKETGNIYYINVEGNLISIEAEIEVGHIIDNNIIYLMPTITNLENMTMEEYKTDILLIKTLDEKKEIMLQYYNAIDMAYGDITEQYEDINQVIVKYYSPYTNLQEVAEGNGLSEDEWLIKEIMSLVDFIIENPDGSFDIGNSEYGTMNGYAVEETGTYKFKVTFLDTTVEKEIDVDEIFEWSYVVNDDNTITLTSYWGKDTVVVVPSEIYGMKVKKIGEDNSSKSVWDSSICEYEYIGSGYIEFRQNTIEKIIIPEGIKEIGENAFMCTENLKEIIIPESINNIGVKAFYECSELTNITIPRGVTSIEWCAFCLCTSLTTITIPNSVTYIGENAFYRCSNLETINIEATEIPSTWDSNWKEGCSATVNTGVEM